MVSLGGVPGSEIGPHQSVESTFQSHSKSNPQTHAIFNRFWNPKWSQNRSKINQKSISDASLFSTLFFGRFLIIFPFPDQAPEPQKSLKTNWFFNFFILSAVSNSCYMYIQILTKFGFILASKIDQKSLPKPNKIDI